MLSRKWKIIITLILVAVLGLSVLAAKERASDPHLQARTIQSIDDKTETVLKLTATSTLASAALSALPQDIATPIANKLADLTEYFLLILCVLYSEKYLLSIIGVGVLKYMIPLCCLLGIGFVWLNKRFSLQNNWFRFILKLLAVSLALFFLIPGSIGISYFIYDTYKSSINTTISSAESLTDEATALTDAEEDKGTGLFKSNFLTDAAERLAEKASGILRRFVEALAVLIATSCLIPILCLLFFLWLIKQITGLDLLSRIPLPKDKGFPRENRRAGPDKRTNE